MKAVKIILIVVACSVGALFLGGIVYGAVQDHNENKKYGDIQYEFVIVDKYDNIGSNWHLVGGRASETEYHIVYKYRVANRPVDHYQYIGWVEMDREVSYSRYRKFNIGDRFVKDEPFFF